MGLAAEAELPWAETEETRAAELVREPAGERNALRVRALVSGAESGGEVVCDLLQIRLAGC